MVQSLLDNNFESETAEGLVLVDFWAPWCGPCRMQAPVLEEIDEALGDRVKVVKVDVDQATETARNFGIMSIPTLLVKKDGQVVETLVGYRAKAQLEDVLGKYL